MEIVFQYPPYLEVFGFLGFCGNTALLVLNSHCQLLINSITSSYQCDLHYLTLYSLEQLINFIGMLSSQLSS